MAGEVWRAPEDNGYYKSIASEHPNIPTRRFDSKDLGMLVRVLSEVYAEWVGIGYCIRIPNKTMEALERQWARKNSVRGLMCVLDEWLRGNFEVTDDENLYPCWRSVVYMVSHDALGARNSRAASTIAQNWQKYERNPFFDTRVAQQVDNTVSLCMGYDRKLEELYGKYLKKINFKWFEVGVLLGVPIHILKDEVENIEQSQKRILKAIMKWLELCMNLEHKKHFPLPTIGILLIAVEHSMGGAHQQLAKDIAAHPFVKSLGQSEVVASQAPPTSSLPATSKHENGSCSNLVPESDCQQIRASTDSGTSLEPKTGQTDTSDAVALMKGFGHSDANWNQKVSDIHVIEISGSLCKMWRKLYPFLGLKEIVANDADRNNFDETEKKMAFFNEWKQQKAYEATYKNLVHALLRVGAREDAISVCEMLAQSLGKKLLKLQPPTTSTASPATIPPPAGEKKLVDFNEDFVSGQLYEYLTANGMPKNDAQKIKDLDIGGAAFLHFGEDFWKANEISTVGLFYISHIKKKKINVTPNVPASTQISKQPSSPPPLTASASDRRLTEREDYSWMVRKLTPYAPKWKRIGEGLGFLHSELSSIEAKPMLLADAPGSFLGKMLADWLEWAPRDDRGSTNYATLYALRTAVDQAGLGRAAREL